MNKQNIAAKMKSYDSSTKNPGSYESHKKRLSTAYSSQAKYVAQKKSVKDMLATPKRS